MRDHVCLPKIKNSFLISQVSKPLAFQICPTLLPINWKHCLFQNYQGKIQMKINRWVIVKLTKVLKTWVFRVFSRTSYKILRIVDFTNKMAVSILKLIINMNKKLRCELQTSNRIPTIMNKIWGVKFQMSLMILNRIIRMNRYIKMQTITRVVTSRK